MYRNFSLFLIPNLKYLQKRSTSKIKILEIPKPAAPMSVTICGGNSNVGQMTALLLKREQIFKNIVLYDTKECYDIVKDLDNINTTPKVCSYTGPKNLGEAICNSRIIYICYNIQTIPGVKTQDLFKENVNIVRQIILYMTEFNPRAMVVILTPPIECMVPMAISEFRKNDILADKQVFGLTGNFVSRTNTLAAAQTNNYPLDKKNFIIGGATKDTIIPVLSHSSYQNMLSSKVELLIQKIKGAEDEVLKAKIAESHTQGCYLSLAYCGYMFILHLAQALNGAENITEHAFVKQKPPIDKLARYFSGVVKFDKTGLNSCHIPKLTNDEKKLLSKAIPYINKFINVGEVYITGREKIPIPRPKILKKEKEEPIPPPKEVPKPVAEEELCKKRPPLKSIKIKN